MDRQGSANCWSLSKQDTLALKGVAIVALLFHHLYYDYNVPYWTDPYSNPTIQWISALCKFCVALFLFCSGYGLSVQYQKIVGVKESFKFILKRFVSFYSNYWIVFVVFVPITVFLFARPLSTAYGNGMRNTIICLGKDLFGIMGFRSYNITWWFNQMIVVLYVLFPIIFWCAKKNALITLILSLTIWRYMNSIFHWSLYDHLLVTYQLPFVMGVLWQNATTNITIYDAFNKPHKNKNFNLLFFIISLLFLFWMTLLHKDERMDAFVMLGVILVVVPIVRKTTVFAKLFSFYGKHSANIYLMHAFIYCYWHLKWLYSGSIMRNGMNLIVVFLICLGTSIFLEFLKEICGLNRLVQTVKTRLS